MFLKTSTLERKNKYTDFLFALSVSVVLTIFIFPIVVDAELMQSTNYTITNDSINSGGLYSTSSSYGEQSTLGEQATGYSTSLNYSLSAGYQQADITYVSISSPPDVDLGSLNGLTGGTAVGTASWRIETNSPAGYTMYINASTSPALKSSNFYFADYVQAGAAPDYSFTLPISSSTFAYSAEGSNISSYFKDNGSACNTGSGNTTDTCYTAFTVSPFTIASAASANNPTGATTTIRMKAGIGSSKIQENGSYQANITATAIAL